MGMALAYILGILRSTVAQWLVSLTSNQRESPLCGLDPPCILLPQIHYSVLYGQCLVIDVNLTPMFAQKVHP